MRTVQGGRSCVGGAVVLWGTRYARRLAHLGLRIGINA